MIKNIYKNLVFFLFPLMLLMSSSVFADDLVTIEENLQNAVEIECAIADTAGVETVAPRSFSICKEDITYNSLYYLFGQVFQDNDVLKYILYDGDEDAMDSIPNGMNAVSGPIITIMSALTYLIFILGSVILSYVTIKFLYKSASTGEFGGNWHSVWVPLRSLTAIILISPIGAISLIQLVVIIVALAGAAIGNYLWGAFLHKFQMDAMVGTMGTSVENQELSYSQANTLVESQLCMDRTKKAVRQSSFFNTGDRGTFLIDTYELDDHMRTLIDCTDESLTYTANAHSVKQGYVKNVSLGNTTQCETYVGILSDVGNVSGYEKELYGEKYTCGYLSFNQVEPQEVIESSNALEMIDDSVGAGNFDWLMLEDYTANEFSNKLQPLVDGVLTGYNVPAILSNLNTKVKDKITNREVFDYQGELETEISALTAVLKSGAGNVYEELELATNQAAALKGMYVAYNVIFTNLMGARIPDDEITMWTNTNELKSDIIEVPAKESGDYLLRDFLFYAKNSSQELMKKHCLELYSNNYTDVRQTVYGLDRNLVDTSTPYEAWLNNSGFKNTECVDYYFNGDVDNSTVAYSPTIIDPVNPDPDLVGLFTNYNPSDSNDVTLLKAQTETKSKEMLLNAEAEKVTLAAWFYIVRESTGRAFSEVLKESIDTDTPVRMRQQGFATAGGYMLSVSLNQASANDLMKKIGNSVRWGSPLGDNNDLFYTTEFYAGNSGDTEDDSLETINKDAVKFSNLSIAGFFSGGLESPETVEQMSRDISDEMAERDAFDKFFSWVENQVFAPTKYLKKSAGIPDSMTLREGIEQCYNAGNCQAPSLHPVNALVFLGSDLVEISMTMLITSYVVDKLAQLTGGDSGGSTGNGDGIGKKVLSFLSKALIVLTTIIHVVNPILQFFWPIWVVLLTAGLFLAYVLPTIPFIAFLLVYIGWIVLVLELVLIAPVWLLLLAVPDANGSGRASGAEAWNFFGQLLLKPAFMVVAVAFAWFLASISVFIVNATIFSVFSPVTESSSGYILPIVNMLFFYLIYITIVFVAILNAFKLIPGLPDQFSKWINIRQSGDRNMVDSMGSDRLLQAVMIYHGQKTLGDSASSYGNAIRQRAQNRNNKDQLDNIEAKLNRAASGKNSSGKEDFNRTAQSNAASKENENDVTSETKGENAAKNDVLSDVQKDQEKNYKDIQKKSSDSADITSLKNPKDEE